MGLADYAKKIWGLVKDVKSLNERVKKLEEENIIFKERIHQLERQADKQDILLRIYQNPDLLNALSKKLSTSKTITITPKKVRKKKK